MGVKCMRCGSNDREHIQFVLSQSGGCTRPITPELADPVRKYPEVGWADKWLQLKTVTDAVCNRLDHEFVAMGLTQVEARSKTDRVLLDVINSLPAQDQVAATKCCDIPQEAHVPPLPPVPASNTSQNLPVALRYLGAKWRRRTKLGLTDAGHAIALLADSRGLVGSASLIANAMALYDALIKEDRAGSTIVVRLKDGTEQVLNLLHLEGKA